MKGWGYDRPRQWLVRRGAGRPDPAIMGDEGPWPLYVPSMWRAIADPSGQHRFPGWRNDEFMAGPAFWSPLPQLLQFSFGWRPLDGPHPAWVPEGPRIEMGTGALRLAEILQHGHVPMLFDKPDPRVRFIKKVWGQSLDVFGAWCLRDSDLLANLRAQRGSPFAPEAMPFVNGLVGDELHLADHWGAPWIEPFASDDDDVLQDEGSAPFDEPTFVLGAAGRATLVTDRYVGWYRVLTDFGASSAASEIDVIVKPVGWLGTYRRSKVTGIWHAGDHELHMLGH